MMEANQPGKNTKSSPDKEAIRTCPICAHDVVETLHHQRFAVPDDYLLPGAYDVVACRTCGFVYADTSATQADYDRFYQEFSKYEDNAVATGGGGTDCDLRRLERTATDLAGFIPDRFAAIMDIGCANGGLLLALKLRGYDNLTGLDPSRACVDHVAKKGMRAVRGGLFDENEADEAVDREQFDVIILSHVLEHVHDVQRAVKNSLRKLKPGGILYVEVPDASRYPDYFIVPYYYFDCEHINHFDEHSLMNLVLPFGCELLTASKKELPVSAEAAYPAVYAVFRKTGEKAPAAELVPDFAVRESVAAYVEKSRGIKTYQEFDELARTREEIIVWGAGSYALRLLEATSLGECTIIAFVDKDSKKQGTKLKGVPICSPEILRNFNGPLVICAALHNREILREIEAMHLDCRVVITA
jgi:SAM-dependent methyltransferase